ncbi:C40 family peptidase [Merdimonas faecis]|uniref:C40 family peptidase n=1 Tax=Merdimonas faecis TaxID=1653435 RepID=UPI00320AC374
MGSNLKKGLFLVTITGAVTAFPHTVQASDQTAAEQILPQAGIEEVLSDCYLSDKEIEVEDYLVPTEKGEYLDMAFANVQTFLYIRSEPTTESEWLGKLYPDNAAKIIGPVGEWTKIQSGTVTGYVYSDYIIIGKNADQKAREMVSQTESQQEEEAFVYAESKEEEAARLQAEAEEAARKAAEEAAAKAQTGQAIVDYACQFIGNPYVWGGTSLTEGADCSGFVQSVFAHFGISLPRTTWDMENVGTPVSYDQAVAGDLILYDGHVGIYMGNGEIVNAINSQRGIGILPATYTNILTVRRLI